MANQPVMFRQGEGLFDFVLMDTVGEAEFMQNLEIRFKKGIIYVRLCRHVRVFYFYC